MKKNQPQKREKKRPGRKLGTKVKHGAYSLIARGELPQKRRYLERFLGDVRQGLIKDLGPNQESLTTAQLILIDRAVGKLGVIRCVEEFAKEAGVIKGHELSPILKRNYLAWANSLRLDLQALGIDRRQTESEMDLAEVVREIDERAAVEKAKAGQGRETGEREIASPESNKEEISEEEK